MTAPGIVRAMALVWLVLVGEAVIEAAFTGNAAWLEGGYAEDLEPHNQEVRFGAAPEVEPVAHLQVAMLQLDNQGCDEALLCAQSMPLLRDQSRQLVLRFRDHREFRHRRNIPSLLRHDQQRKIPAGGVRALRYSMLPAGFIGTRAGVLLEVAHGGMSNGVHNLQIKEGWLRGGSQRMDIPGDLLAFPSMQVRESSCTVQLSEVLNVAVVIRVSSQPIPDEVCATRAFWREAVAAMATKSSVSADQAEVHPDVNDAALAAVVFRNTAIVDRLRDEHSEWFLTSKSKWAHLLSARWDRIIESPFDLYPRVRDVAPDRAYVARGKSVQSDAAGVAELDSWLVVYYPFSWPLLGVLALLSVVLVLRAPSTGKAHVLIGRSGLLLLLVSHFLEIAGFTGSLFGLVFLIMLLPRMPRGTDRMYRLLAALGLLAAIAWVVAWVVAPRPDPAFVAFAVLGRMLCWFVIGHWVVTDSSWQSPRTFVLFLVALSIAGGAGVLHHAQVPTPTVEWIAAGARWLAPVLLIAFCAAGRRRASLPEPEPALQST